MASVKTPTRTRTRCSTASTRCGPGSSRARPSTATGYSAPSSSRGRWIARSKARARREFLWEDKQVVPFLKVDKGLADEVDGAQVMKPMPDLDALCERAVTKGVFGTKMRSVIKLGNPTGVAAVVEQQFDRRSADPRPWTRPDHRARGGHPQPGEGGCRGAAAGRDHRAARRARCRSAGDAEADPARAGQLLCRSDRRRSHPQGGGAVRWVFPRGSQRPIEPQPLR